MRFKNEILKTLQDVMDRLCDTINDLTKKNGKKYHIKRLDRTYKILQFLKGISISKIS